MTMFHQLDCIIKSTLCIRHIPKTNKKAPGHQIQLCSLRAILSKLYMISDTIRFKHTPLLTSITFWSFGLLSLLPCQLVWMSFDQQHSVWPEGQQLSFGNLLVMKSLRQHPIQRKLWACGPEIRTFLWLLCTLMFENHCTKSLVEDIWEEYTNIGLELEQDGRC